MVDITTDIKSELIRTGAVTDPASPKGALLSKAAHLFRTQGYERTTVRDIGREVGILPGSIFHHFRSKDEILRTVMRESIILNLTRMRQALQQASTLDDRLRALIWWELYATNGETGEAWTVLIREWRSLSAEGQEEILELRREYEELWLDVLNEAYEQGLIELKPDILRRFVGGALNWTSNWFRSEGDLSLEELGEEVLRLILRGDGHHASDMGEKKAAP